MIRFKFVGTNSRDCPGSGRDTRGHIVARERSCGLTMPPKLTSKRIRRGSFFSVENLEKAIEEFLSAWNKNRPYVELRGRSRTVFPGLGSIFPGGRKLFCRQ